MIKLKGNAKFMINGIDVSQKLIEDTSSEIMKKDPKVNKQTINHFNNSILKNTRLGELLAK